MPTFQNDWFKREPMADILDWCGGPIPASSIDGLTADDAANPALECPGPPDEIVAMEETMRHKLAITATMALCINILQVIDIAQKNKGEL